MIEIEDIFKIIYNFDVNLLVLMTAFPLSYFFGFFVCCVGVLNFYGASYFVWLFSYYVRSIPLVVILVFFYFGLSGTVLGFDPAYIAIFVFSLYYTAILAEKFRSAFLQIGEQSFGMGFALGFTRRKVLFHVFLPQAAIVSLPAAANASLGMLKDTAILSAISVMDAITSAKSISSISFNVVGPYIVLYFLFLFAYVVLFLFVSWIGRHLHHRYGLVP